MFYFDNAATTMQKPPEVAEAVVRGLSSFGGVGRGVHPASLAAGRAVFDARVKIARLLGVLSASCISFALNATMALISPFRGWLCRVRRWLPRWLLIIRCFARYFAFATSWDAR